jgi:hypothetical protein
VVSMPAVHALMVLCRSIFPSARCRIVYYMLLMLTVDLLLGREILVHLLEVRVEISLVGRHGVCGGGLVNRRSRV